MGACVELLLNGQYNWWCWAICITLCKHGNVLERLTKQGKELGNQGETLQKFV